ncbi:MAG TPA: UbiA family prenyltransferase [Fodinibius sp.]|nr:UbiA family prenyltransferase [Fodinibius sp.]
MNQSGSVFLGQIWHFILHLRLHYQFLILSGAYLMGSLVSEGFYFKDFLIQFLNVHVLLFGGATAYNSFWDKDEGPIGGLSNPPEMAGWMWSVSLGIQAAGFVVAWLAGLIFTGFYTISLLLFWLYSSPLTRWKSHPHKSFAAIGISTGFNPVMMGVIASGGSLDRLSVWIIALGVMLILLSLYPISQVYQMEEDSRRGDRTFALAYGKKGVLIFFKTAFSLGLILTAAALSFNFLRLGILFGAGGVLIALVINHKIAELFSAEEGSYRQVMSIKYGTSLAFVCFLLASLILKYGELPLFKKYAEWLFS